jgi:hypothetical protein
MRTLIEKRLKTSIANQMKVCILKNKVINTMFQKTRTTFEGATFHDETFNAQSNTTCLIHSDLFTVLKKYK